MVAACLNSADDHIEAQVVRRILIQAHFEIPRLRRVLRVHHVPFYVKDPVWRSAGDGGKNAARVCPR